MPSEFEVFEADDGEMGLRYVPGPPSALVLTEDEWWGLAEVCKQWLNGDTNRSASESEEHLKVSVVGRILGHGGHSEVTDTSERKPE